MDLRDFQILLELSRQPFASNENLGRAIGVTGNAVKARLQRMEDAHLLNGFYVMPSASVFRRFWQVFPFGPVEREPNLEKVLAIDGVVNVWRGRPRTLMVNVYARSADAPPPPQLVRVLHQTPLAVAIPERPDRFSFAEATLSSLEWRVLDALLERPRASLVELAETTGLTPRTVRKRRDSLFARGLLAIAPNFDSSGESGLLIYSGYVEARQSETLESLRAPGLVVLHRLHKPPAAWIFGHTATYAELQEVEIALRGIPGVAIVELVPSRGGRVATDRLHRWIHDELRAWSVPVNA
jgi:DNA-binding Lrp family transcriptional regulator